MEEFKALETPALRQRLDAGEQAPWSLVLLIALNLLAWGAMMLAPQNAAGFWGDPDALHLHRSGGLTAHAVLVEHEYWRLLTAPFLHAGWFHLASNLFFLWVFGRYAVRWYGNGQFVVLYMLCALAGAVASLYFASRSTVSVGASGALFGVTAAMLCSAFQHQGVLGSAQQMKLSGAYGIFLVTGITSGFSLPAIDHAAHFGGALLGGYLGWFLIERFETGGQRVRSAGHRLAAMLPVLMVLALALLLAPQPTSDIVRQFVVKQEEPR